MGRKGKAVVASSSKALEVCGDTSRLRISAADVFAQFGGGEEEAPKRVVTAAPNSAVQAPGLEDAEVSMALHALQKRDLNTRLRGVGELRELLAARSNAALKEICGPFLHVYTRLWPQDAEPRVREGLQRCLLILVEALQRDFAKQLRSAFPTWLCAMFDTHTEVTQTARRAFATVFANDEKRRGVFRHCQAECLELFRSNIRHSEQSLHDELGFTAKDVSSDKNVSLERHDRYVRVVAASLSGLGELVHVCASSAKASDGSSGSSSTSLTADDLAPFFAQGSPCGLWTRLAAKQPAPIRRAAAECLVRILQSPAADDSCATAAARSSAINALADEAIPPAVGAALVCSFARAGGAACWEGLSPNKGLWPQLAAAITRGSKAPQTGLLQRLPDLLAVLPVEFWTPGRGETLLQALLGSLPTTTGHLNAEIWRAYLRIVRAADMAEQPVKTAWRWHPLVLYLPGTAGTDTGEDPPPFSAPAAALAALPGVIAEEAQVLLESPQASGEFLDILIRGAPAVDGTGEGTTAQWHHWFRLVARLLDESLSVPEELRTSIASLLAQQMRSILSRLCKLAEQGDKQALLLMDVFGETVALRGIVAQHSWVDAAHVETITDNEVPSEVALLRSLLLPLCQSLLRKDAAMALELGQRVLRPLLHSALRRRGESQLSLDAVRDIMSQFLLTLQPPQQRRGAAIQLLISASPGELQMQLAQPLHLAVVELTQAFVDGDDESESALRLALSPGGLAIDQVSQCLEILVSSLTGSLEGKERALLVATFCCGVLVSHGEAAPALLDLRGRASKVLLNLLLVTDASVGILHSDAAVVAWELLPKLVRGLTQSLVYEALPHLPEAPVARNTWVRMLSLLGTALSVHPVLLVCQSRGGNDGLRMQGQVLVQQLRLRALATWETLRQGGPLNTSTTREALAKGLGLLLWELLLARELFPDLDAIAESSLAQLFGRSLDTACDFLWICVVEASQEGSRWMLSVDTADSAEALDGRVLHPSRLHGLSAIGHVLDALWSNQEALGDLAGEVLGWALDPEQSFAADQACRGFLAASMLERCGRLRVPSPQGTTESVLSTWHLSLQKALTKKEFNPAMLSASTAVERWAAAVSAAAKPERRHVAAEGLQAGQHTQEPLIAEAEGAGIVAPEVAGDIDTGLLERLEHLLRWAQARDVIPRGDVFCTYAAATWQALQAAVPALSSSSAEVKRMHRLISEMLQARGEVGLQACPGALLLVSALAEAGLWPNSSWPAVLEAVLDVSRRLPSDCSRSTSPSCLPHSREFRQTTARAAASVLRHVPESLVSRVVPLLCAEDTLLQDAAAARLQRHAWVPAERPSSGQEEGEEAEKDTAAKGVLDHFEALLQQEDEPPVAEASDVQAAVPSCGSVSFAVITDLVGADLAGCVWSVDAALVNFLEWEAEDEEEDEDEEGEGEESTAGKPGSSAAVVRPATKGTKVGAKPGGKELPASLLCACKAALAPWEMLLLHAQSASNSPAAPATGAKQPPELLARALELSPDHLAKVTKSDWNCPEAPALQSGRSLMDAFLQLVCHILTCQALAGEAGAEERLSQALCAAVGPGGSAACVAVADFGLLELAGRSLLLALRVLPGAVRNFWNALPRRRDRDLVEQLIARSFTPLLVPAEALAAGQLLDSERERLSGVEASTVRRCRQLVLQLKREELEAELCLQLPEAFPLRPATAEVPERMPGIPRPSVRNWMLQARQVLAGSRSCGIGRAMLMWARSYALFFEGTEDCPICYNVVHLSTHTIPRKACPTCKHKFHSECLYHWFKTSGKSTCPLCNQPF